MSTTVPCVHRSGASLHNMYFTSLLGCARCQRARALSEEIEVYVHDAWRSRRYAKRSRSRNIQVRRCRNYDTREDPMVLVYNVKNIKIQRTGAAHVWLRNARIYTYELSRHTIHTDCNDAPTYESRSHGLRGERTIRREGHKYLLAMERDRGYR